MKTYLKLIAGLILISITLCACSIGEKNEKKLFDAMKEEGLLEFDCEYEDYDEVRRVDQSPIPDVVTYYDYEMDDAVYTLDYRQVNPGGNGLVYQVSVAKKSDEDKHTDIYYFDRDTFEYRGKR